MNKQLAKMVAAAVLMVGSVVAGQASASILFTGGPGGTVSFAGGTSTLMGSGINISAITGTNDTTNVQTFTSANAAAAGLVLNFTTGPGALGLPGTNSVNFAGGGTFTVTNTNNFLLNNGNTILAGGNILTGSFTGASANLTSLGATTTLLAISGVGVDTKNPLLLVDVGPAAGGTVPGGPIPTFNFANTEIGLSNITAAPGSVFSARVVSASILNTAVAAPGVPVPEPATLLMMGLGLVGMFSMRRRHNNLG